MAGLTGFGNWLKSGTKLPWGQLAKQSVDATKAMAELSKVWPGVAPKLSALKDLDRVDSFFKAFESPVGKLAVGALPLASVGIELLKLYLDVTKTEPTFESSVVISAQMAYLESLAGVLVRADAETKAKLEQVNLATIFERQLEKSESVSLTKTRAKKTLTQLRKSEVVEVLDEVLSELLLEAGLLDWQVTVLVDQTAWGTPKYFHGVVAELKDEVEPLAEFLRSDGLRIQEKFDSIDDYLTDEIEPLPRQQVFDEADPLVTFNDLYVPLSVQPLDISGNETDESVVSIHAWADQLLNQSEPRKVGFIEGAAGRGKSVFCRMFAAMVRMERSPEFIPILIRLRDVRILENNLTKTLATHFQVLDFVQSDSGWLTDENTRFLLIFDGFDELLLQGRESGGLKELIQQLGDFQRNSHHQCLVTGRPLALQGIDRVLSQTDNLSRVRLELMAYAQRTEWLDNWSKLFGKAEAQDFKSFLLACPQDIGRQLAREPLLLYLLGRLHREKLLNVQMFVDTKGTQSKVRVYDEAVKWVLERQRQDFNERISGLETEDLRQVFREAALCVTQSGNETAQLMMLKGRFTDSTNPVAELLKQAQKKTEKTEDRALTNLLTAFYLKPGKGDRNGSVEFSHKSFGEFLFAERLQVSFEDWTELDKRGRLRMSEGEMARQTYDLLGYGPLTVEVVDYLKDGLFSTVVSDSLVQLFQRLKQFYEEWCEGVFIDNALGENLPQIKMMQMNVANISVGLRQVDIHTGLNVLILLFVFHKYGQHHAEEEYNSLFHFHPCVSLDSDEIDDQRLLGIIGYSQLIRLDHFRQTIGRYLSFASLNFSNLSGANLSGANLSGANLIGANLSGANLSGANLIYAALTSAALSGANLRAAYFINASLVNADLSNANIGGVDFSDANLGNSDLRGADLVNANLGGANLSDANLGGADLSSANLSGANLIDAKIINAYLNSANLSGANLSGANLSGANLHNVNLSYANLKDVYFSEETNWEGICGLEIATNVPEILKQHLCLT